jgi:preprotein translocase subunit SecG
MPASIATIAPLSTLAFTWPGWLVGIIIALFLFVCVILVLAVLIQKPQGGGLASAFGGGASAGQTAFGTKTGDALTVVTISVFALYLLLAIILNYAAQPQVVSPEPQAEGTTAPLLLLAPSCRSAMGVSKSAIVNSIPRLKAGSVGSPTTPPTKPPGPLAGKLIQPAAVASLIVGASVTRSLSLIVTARGATLRL